MDELLGKKIRKMYMNDEKDVIVFETDRGELIGFRTEADCCNHVWFDKVTGVSALRRYDEEVFDILAGGAYVSNVDVKGWVELKNNEEYGDVLENCVITLATDRGYLDIEVRNSHNGYYGGRIDRMDVQDASKYNLLKDDVE